MEIVGLEPRRISASGSSAFSFASMRPEMLVPCSTLCLSSSSPELNGYGTLTCSGVPPITCVSAPAAIEQATPTSPWQPTSAPEIEAFSLNSEPIAAAVSRKTRVPSSVERGVKR